MSLSITNRTPKKDGFRMPGEFEQHAGTWMLWPVRTDTWRNGAKPAQQVFAKVVSSIAEFEPVTVGVNAEQYENARAMLPHHVRVVEISSNDAWMRDIGPTFVKNEEGVVRGINWGFNAWGGLQGGLYFPWDLDLMVKKKVLEIENKDCYECTEFILEGGSITVDGEGTLITTEQCLLNKNRNPHLSKSEIEDKLKEYLNIEKVIWLKDGLIGDETDGHVDDLAFFVRPGEVAIGWTEDVNHPQYHVHQEAYEILKEATDAKGRSLTIHKIELPNELILSKEASENIDFASSSYKREEGMPFVATYINCYLCNGAVIVPSFDDPSDDKARKKFEEIYPDRKVILIDTRELPIAGGNIHCITQQQPASTFQKNY
ncbi:agmatine deiminase [Priestia endophytica]|uniref:agmatine deiminase n=1 Tax=Priestia endophytica TaxID=135735 RepID=UPI00227ECF23|nr:agmatine deiminase [Priestia endophytica]